MRLTGQSYKTLDKHNNTEYYVVWRLATMDVFDGVKENDVIDFSDGTSARILTIKVPCENSIRKRYQVVISTLLGTRVREYLADGSAYIGPNIRQIRKRLWES